MSNDIWIRRGEIDKARREKMREVMDEYDDTVYYPALKQLREDCEKDGGHRGGTFHDNGLGSSWFYCGRCGARYDITAPTEYELAPLEEAEEFDKKRNYRMKDDRAKEN